VGVQWDFPVPYMCYFLRRRVAFLVNVAATCPPTPIPKGIPDISPVIVISVSSKPSGTDADSFFAIAFGNRRRTSSRVTDFAVEAGGGRLSPALRGVATALIRRRRPAEVRSARRDIGTARIRRISGEVRFPDRMKSFSVSITSGSVFRVLRVFSGVFISFAFMRV